MTAIKSCVDQNYYDSLTGGIRFFYDGFDNKKKEE